MCCVGISRIARECHEIGEIRDSNTTLRSGVLCLGSGCRRSRANAMKSGNSENKARRADAALDFLHQRIDTLRARARSWSNALVSKLTSNHSAAWSSGMILA